MTTLSPHPDRLLPADGPALAAAQHIYASIADLPIYSPHGHVDATMLADNSPFADPADLLITPDHYVTRMMHAHGVSLDSLGLKNRAASEGAPGLSARDIWRTFCSHWNQYLGTPVRYWFETELHDVFGITVHPSPETADALFDQISDKLAKPEFLPRALFEKFNIKVLATTDDPSDSLEGHQRLRDDPTFTGQVIPTFRADRYQNPAEATWVAKLAEIEAVSGINTNTYQGLLDALRNRREFFKTHGATATDTGAPDAWATPLTSSEAERIHQAGRNGTVSAADAQAYQRNMIYQSAAMACEDGLVMQFHPGVVRNHHQPTFDAYGPDSGHDLPDVGGFVRPLQQLLNDFGTHPNFTLALFTVDETVFSREIAPLSGFYPSVFAGAPWWFIDTPAAIERYRAAVTDSAGFFKTTGFIDDTRAFCSIPARHDMSRRCDAAYLGRLVATHQMTLDDALTVAHELTVGQPQKVFKLQ